MAISADSQKIIETMITIFVSGGVVGLAGKMIWEFLSAPRSEIKKLRDEFETLQKDFVNINIGLIRVSKRLDKIQSENKIKIENMQNHIDGARDKFRELYETISDFQINLAVLVDRIKKKGP